LILSDQIEIAEILVVGSAYPTKSLNPQPKMLPKHI
jgi:hypothetical protein